MNECMNEWMTAQMNPFKATINKNNENGTTTIPFHSSQTYMLLAFWLANPNEMTIMTIRMNK